jgi:threonine dehydrogenase-like Zn-dependent dehydrogenase
MNAAIFYSPNNLSVQEIQFPTDQDEKRGVMLKVNACAICGYDVRFRNPYVFSMLKLIDLQHSS